MTTRPLLVAVIVLPALLAGCTGARPAALADAMIILNVEPREPFVARTSNTFDVEVRSAGPETVNLDPPALGHEEEPGSLFLRIAWKNGTAYVPESGERLVVGGVYEEDHPGCADLVPLEPGSTLDAEASVGGFEPGAFNWQANQEYRVTIFYATTCSQATWRGVVSASSTVVPQPYDDG